MAFYDYRCAAGHGAFEVTRSLGDARESEPCPVCAQAAPRVFASPMLRRAPRAVVAAVDGAEKSRWEPDVVRSLPASGQRSPVRMAPPDPRLAKLPRP